MFKYVVFIEVVQWHQFMDARSAACVLVSHRLRELLGSQMTTSGPCFLFSLLLQSVCVCILDRENMEKGECFEGITCVQTEFCQHLLAGLARELVEKSMD